VSGVGSAAWQHKFHPFFVWQTLRWILGIEGKQREPWSWNGHLVVGWLGSWYYGSILDLSSGFDSNSCSSTGKFSAHFLLRL